MAPYPGSRSRIPPRFTNGLPIVLLILFSFLLCSERTRTFSEPFERDISTYAVVAHELLSGRLLYTDLWDHKPPAIHLTYAWAESIAGYGPLSIFILNVMAGVMTLFAIYRAGKVIGGSGAGLWAAAFWVPLSGDLYLEANQPNTEVFQNVFLTWAFVFWLEREPFHFRWGQALKIGLMFTLASLYKPTALFPMALVMVVSLIFGKIEERKAAIVTIGVGLSMSLLAWGFVGSWFWFRGGFVDFYHAVFAYNFFIQSRWQSAWVTQGWGNIWPGVLYFSLPLLAVGVWGFLTGRKENPRPWMAWGAFAFGTEWSILFPGNFFPHYYQLWLPVLAIGAAWGSFLLSGKMKPIGLKGLTLPPILLMGLILFHEVPFYRLGAVEWSRLKYQNTFLDIGKAADYINSLLKPGETFYEWGNETGLYMESSRKPPAGVFYAYPMASGPLKEELTDRTLLQLEKEKPELFLFNRNYWGPTADDPRIFSWFKDRYEVIPESSAIGPYLFMMRKEGDLAKRIAQKKM